MTVHDNQVSWWNQLMGYFSGYPAWLVGGVFAFIIGFFSWLYYEAFW